SQLVNPMEVGKLSCQVGHTSKPNGSWQVKLSSWPPKGANSSWHVELNSVR
ncbi:hypothetical protein Csa_023730, partial [Cucumis sativus]